MFLLYLSLPSPSRRSFLDRGPPFFRALLPRGMKGTSAFRFATVSPEKQEYKHARLFDPSPTSASIACSSSFVAANAVSQGRVVILPADYTLYRPTSVPPTVSGHTGGTADLTFSPFHPELLATCGDECVRGWRVPSSVLEEDLIKPDFDVSMERGSPNALQFHPHVDELLAVGCKSGAELININSATSSASFDTKDAVTSIVWDYFGKQLACVGKSYNLYTCDPRTVKGTTVKGTKGSGFRPQNALYNGRDGKLIVAGLSSSRQPEIRIFDPRNLSESLVDQELNLAPGYMMPIYDVDTRLLAVTLRCVCVCVCVYG